MSSISKKVDEFKDDIIESTRELVKIRSVEGEPKDGKPFGEEVNTALEKALDISQKLGFKTVNMNGYIGYAEYGEGEDYVAVLGHLDVVPEGNGWKYPPYAAEIHDGKMYGRGTMDDKSPIVAALYGLKAIKDLDIKLSKRVRIIFGTNEETGCHEMEYYNKREKDPVAGFTPDAEYPIVHAEKGITIFDFDKELKVNNSAVNIEYINGGDRPNMVPDYCECRISSKELEALKNAIGKFISENSYDIEYEVDGDSIVIKSRGLAAHGSLPELGKNSIMQMFKLLGTLPIEKSDIGEYIEFFNKHVGFETSGESFGIGIKDEESGKLTFNVGKISMDKDRVTISVNVRYPVTYDYDKVMNEIENRLKGTQIEIKNMMHQKPLYFPKDHPLIKSLQRVYTEQTGLEAKLLAIGGGTYAKEMANIVGFGPILPGEPDLDHQTNEYVKLEDLILNAKIYANAIYELAK
ncbi:dipeptidase PepV [Clostridium fermenticellae]|uniref:Dipeptidase PepV n=1 Tax=Clostridium fermenticellae TaxID=2068654 RepID=A0A386H521_9CLOT|nr:dipeptidase PepV [Clostridium fermenticellae]AYD40851.1 dipeptidase PepV [Clostridium fermenticellae]